MTLTDIASKTSMTTGPGSESSRDRHYLPFALPDIDQSEFDAVNEVLRSGWLTTGAKTKTFEALFARAIGVKEAVAVNSCTAALHLALEAVGVSQGTEVVTTPYTFAATAEVINYLGARPVFVDIDAETLNIDPTRLEAAVSERTRAVIPVHVAGLPADLDAIGAVADSKSIAVIDDAAHAFPSCYKGRPIGKGTRATCFSFYATKTLTTGEGGMITTDDRELADRCRLMSLHGISRDAWKRYTAEGSWYYEILEAGYKYNMTDIAAALGIAQLAKAERMRIRREAIASRYDEGFAELEQVQRPSRRADSLHAWHLYQLRLNLPLLNCDRGEFMARLHREGIGASVHFIPLHLHPYYRRTYGFQPEDFPHAFSEYLREVSLPIYSSMSDSDVDRVIETVQRTLVGARRRRSNLCCQEG